MLAGRTEDGERLDAILAAVAAGVQRDERLMAAVEAAAERDRQIIEDVRRISSALEKKSKRELAKRAKQTALEQFEITLESVEAESFDQGGQGAVHMARYANETVCLKKIQLAGPGRSATSCAPPSRRSCRSWCACGRRALSRSSVSSRRITPTSAS